MAFIIAEAGVNHDGDMAAAQELIRKAVESGADAVKFQYFSPKAIVHPNARRANYQLAQKEEATQDSLLKRLQLSHSQFEQLKSACDQQGIEFMATPFDIEALDRLIDMEVRRIKISSGDIDFFPLLLAAARAQKPILLSTGMATLGEVERALAVIAYGALEKDEPDNIESCYKVYWQPEAYDWLSESVTLLQCTSEYPTAAHLSHLRALITFQQAFGLKLGFSDHTLSIGAACAAVALGANVFEKHFTLSCDRSGPDHSASLEPKELTQYVREIRAAESALGYARKQPTVVEQSHRSLVRRGLYASQDLAADEAWKASDIAWLRPAYGVSNAAYWPLFRQTRARPYASLEPIFTVDTTLSEPPDGQ